MQWTYIDVIRSKIRAEEGALRNPHNQCRLAVCMIVMVPSSKHDVNVDRPRHAKFWPCSLEGSWMLV